MKRVLQFMAEMNVVTFGRLTKHFPDNISGNFFDYLYNLYHDKQYGFARDNEKSKDENWKTEIKQQQLPCDIRSNTGSDIFGLTYCFL